MYKENQCGVIVNLKSGETVFIPTSIKFAKLNNFGAKILDFDEEDKYFTAHWMSNFNTSGDFRSELMRFDANGVMDNGDLQARNAYRIANGLLPIN